MSKKDSKTTCIVFAIAGFFLIGTLIFALSVKIYRNQTVLIDKGYVTELDVNKDYNDIRTDFYITINNETQYQIDDYNYVDLEIGDYVYIYPHILNSNLYSARLSI